MIKPLFQEIYRVGMLAGATDCIVGTRADLIGVFERFGFRRTCSQVVDPIANDIHVLNLDSHDLAHMREVDSPLTQIAEKLIAQNRLTSKVTA